MRLLWSTVTPYSVGVDAAFAILFLGEQFAAYHALGLALILSGVWLAARSAGQLTAS